MVGNSIRWWNEKQELRAQTALCLIPLPGVGPGACLGAGALLLHPGWGVLFGPVRPLSEQLAMQPPAGAGLLH